MAKRFPTGPVKIVPEPNGTEADLTPLPVPAWAMSLQRSFADHAELDRKELGEIRATVNRQPTTTVVGVLVAIATIIGAILHGILGLG